MDDLPHSTPREVAKRFRTLGEGLTNPADIAAVNKYADELDREAEGPLPKFEERPDEEGALAGV